MEKKAPTPMTPFDEWTVPKELHTLKLLLPYTPSASQQALGILIKVIELQHTIQYFDQQKNFLHEQDISSGFSSPMEMLEEISPYLPPEQASMLETFRNMMNIMDMVQMMQTFSENTGNTFSGDSGSESENSFQDSGSSQTGSDTTGGGFNPMQLVMGMLSPEQKDMFEMYQTMFSQSDEPAAPEFSSGDVSASDFPENTSVEKDMDTNEEQSEGKIPDNGMQGRASWDTELQKFETPDIESQNIKLERIGTDYE